MTPIAVVGIDCRFPGAVDKDAFWRLLMDGVVTDREIPGQRWDIDRYYHPDGIPGTMNTRRAHFLDDVDAFDSNFFGIAPVEAAALDPQQRLLLQASWRALEDASIDPKSLAGTETGVFVGVMSSEWSSRHMFDYARLSPFHGSGSGCFMLANRISYHLNLIGPSMAVDTACSSSLVALHQACAALREGEADTVIAGGANLMLTPALSVFYTQAGLSAPDGCCKPFCAGADGIGRGEGVAAVVLRRLDDAVAAGQQVYAVVRSSAVNHDGRSNGITAPNRLSQVALMRRALRSAEVDAGQLSFVEAHGTGTVVGDMIEANALGDIHRGRNGQPCLLGSAKGNIGHTEGAAGIASFIKACLALHHRVVPPTVVVGEPNSALGLESKGLWLAGQPQELPAGAALGAVSSFGLGGSNAHVVLESAPALPSPDRGTAGVLTLSAPNETGLRRNARAVLRALRGLDEQRVAAWCRTTNVVKRSQRLRLALGGDRDVLIEGLEAYLRGTSSQLDSAAPLRKGPPQVGLLCPGQGTGYVGMTRPLYDVHPVYREQLEAVCSVLDRHCSAPMLPTIFGDRPGLSETCATIPALFAVAYALGKTLVLSGVRPVFGVGHGTGEIAAACLAGALSVQDAASMAVTLGELTKSLPLGGGMLAVDFPARQAQSMIANEPDCAISAINGPSEVTISGPIESLAVISAAAYERGGRARSLPVSRAFHSPMMRPIAAEFRCELTGLTPKESEFPIFSTSTGTRVAGHDMDAEYWTAQITSPVVFFDAMRAAAGEVPESYLAEAGPGASLLTMAHGSGLSTPARSLTLCSGEDSDGSELLSAAAALLRDGYPLELSQIYGRAPGTLERTPPYSFDPNTRFWFADDPAEAAV